MKFRLVEDFLGESKADEQRLIDFAGEDIAQKFLKLRQRFKAPENDLYYWIKNKTPQELKQAVNNLETTKSNTQQKKEISDKGATLVCDSEHWKVYRITTYEASQKYGRDSKWCITGLNGYGDTYWNQYATNDVEFYFAITKQEYDDRGTKSKYAIGVHYPSGSYEVYNQQDTKCKLRHIPYWEEIQIPDVDLTKMDDEFPFTYFCRTCGIGLPDYDVVFGTDDEPYCNDCFSERYFTCDSCYEVFDIEECNETADGECICNGCLEYQLDESTLTEASIDPEGKYTDYGTGKVTDDNIFDDRTHVSFYDQLFTNPDYMAKEENLKGHIEMMSPREYFEECATKIFPNSSVESLVKSRKADPRVLDEIKDIIVKYKRQVFLPYLNYAEQNQEGLHRMLVAAELFGWDHKFPVLVIEHADEELAQQRKKAKEEDRIRRYIKDAVDSSLHYNYDKIEEFEEECKAQVDYKFDFIDEKVKSFSVKHNNDGYTEVEVNNVVYQFDTDEIKVNPSRENSDNVDELEWDDLDIELDDLSDEEIKDLNNLDIDEFLKKYGF